MRRCEVYTRVGEPRKPGKGVIRRKAEKHLSPIPKHDHVTRASVEAHLRNVFLLDLSRCFCGSREDGERVLNNTAGKIRLLICIA